MHSKKTAFIVEHDFIMAAYLADRVIVYEGIPSKEAYARTPQSLLTGGGSTPLSLRETAPSASFLLFMVMEWQYASNKGCAACIVKNVALEFPLSQELTCSVSVAALTSTDLLREASMLETAAFILCRRMLLMFRNIL